MNVEIHDARFRTIIGDDVTIEQLGTGYRFTEGPVWHPHERHLTFSDIPGNQLWRWSASGGFTSFRDPSNKTNGNTYDRKGRMLSCEHATSRVTRAEPDGAITVLATSPHRHHSIGYARGHRGASVLTRGPAHPRISPSPSPGRSRHSCGQAAGPSAIPSAD